MNTPAAKIVAPDEGEIRRLRPPSRTGEVNIKVDPRTAGSSRLAMGTQLLVPGGRIPMHLHQKQEEILFVQSGEGEVVLDGARYPVCAGTTLFVPPMAWHGVENSGPEPMLLVWVITPPGLEEMFREIGSLPEEASQPLSQEEFAGLVTRHDMRVWPGVELRTGSEPGG
jgi:mannose-6-phosphate isomerase-like protein (cupin superfamily)